MSKNTKTPMSFVTTLTKLQPIGNGLDNRDTRCVGYFSDITIAINAVLQNAGDINEAGYYPLCVIETLSEGIYPDTHATRWFEWSKELEGYQERKGPPDDLKNVCNFAIG